MSLGRRKIGLADTSAWVFNRIADVYDARPPYPAELVAALAAWAEPSADLTGAEPSSAPNRREGEGERASPSPAARVSRGRRQIGDIGAGIGHMALPLAALGFDVIAIEPAAAMLARLRAAASAQHLPVSALHATAEALPLPAESLDLALIADALHFLDAERAGAELRRVLAPGGALAVVLSLPADTPFMRAVVQIMEEAAPRRPRALAGSLAQLAAVAEVALSSEQHFHDEREVDAATLERILRSISFIGPAMNPARFAAFRARVHALPDPPRWARKLTLHAGRRCR